jgi:hypothetical protein
MSSQRWAKRAVVRERRIILVAQKGEGHMFDYTEATFSWDEDEAAIVLLRRRLTRFLLPNQQRGC